VDKQSSVFINKIRKKVSKTMIKYSMVKPNDRVLIAFSGGKDSIVVSDILYYLQQKVRFNFELSAIMIGNADLNIKFINNKMEKIKIEIINFNTKKIISTSLNKHKYKKNSYCQICSRIRRGSIYQYAIENNYNKIVLGHHLDDVIETFFMNQFYQAKLETMKPIFNSDDKKNIVIRPMHSILEQDIIKYFSIMEFETLKTTCPFGTTKSKRSETKKLLDSLSNIEKYNIYHSIEGLF
jgi:tRNA 2-thiocytidine biosynthesis protein TtcA